MKRSDIVLVGFPHPSGLRGKKRPAVIVQSDSYASLVNTLIVAEVTSNLAMASDPACFLIDAGTPDGRAAGVVRDSVVSCLVLVTKSVELGAVAEIGEVVRCSSCLLRPQPL